MTTDHFHQKLHHVVPKGLSGDTAQTSGMTRVEAISGKTVGSEALWMGETHVAASTASGNHHHGESETAIYVVRKSGLRLLRRGGRRREEAGDEAGRLHLRPAVGAAPGGEPRPGERGRRRDRPHDTGGDRRQPAVSALAYLPDRKCS